MLESRELPNQDVTDIDHCDDVIFVTWSDMTNKSLGYLDVYRVSGRQTVRLELVHSIQGESLVRSVMFNSKVDQIGLKWDKPRIFSDLISVHFGSFKCEKVMDVSCIPFEANLILF